jgi:hypothetical protein
VPQRAALTNQKITYCLVCKSSLLNQTQSILKEILLYFEFFEAEQSNENKAAA